MTNSLTLRRDFAATLPVFAVVGVDDPIGMKPGRYWYVCLLSENRKVSRYCRRIETAFFKRGEYAVRYYHGDRNWPAVGRVDELRDSKYAVPTRTERHMLKVLTFFRRYGYMPHLARLPR